MLRRIPLIITVVFLLHTAHSSYAQSDSAKAGVIGLDHLLNLKITVASKQEEQIADAPGSVTVYTAADMTKLGYYTLSDLANITAGYSSFESIGEKTFETRGQKADGFDNNKHLVLIDGVPFSHTRANKAFSDNSLTLMFAERVEFLKGPGSSLYGISAFYGVINIIPKELDKSGTLIESRFSLGNYDFKRRAMFSVLNRTKAGTSKLYVSYFGKDATFAYLGDGTQPNALSRYYDDQTSFFVYGAHRLDDKRFKGTSIGFLFSHRTTGLGDFWMAQQSQTYQYNQITWETLEPYLRYQRKWGRFSISSYLKGNMSLERAYVGGYQNTFNSGQPDTLLGVQLYNIRVLDKELFVEGRYDVIRSQRWGSNLIMALNMDSRYSTGHPQSYSWQISNGPGLTFIPDASFYNRSSKFNTYSASLQYQQRVNFLNGLMVTAGGRFDAGRAISAEDGSVTNSYNQFSPRIALVQQIGKHFNVKAMYGRAIRAPLIKEVGLNEEARQSLINDGREDLTFQIPNLTAEHLNSYELGLIYKGKKFSTVLTGFINRTENRLSRTPIDGDPSKSMTINMAGLIKASGGEVEVMWLPYPNLKLSVNYATAHALNPDGSDVGNVPTQKLNGIVYYSLLVPLKIDFGLTGHWVKSWRTGVLAEPFNPTNDPALNNQTLPGYFVSDLNISWTATDVIRVEMQIRNILDADIRTPSFVQSGMYNVPNPGRSFLFSLAFRFN